MGSQRPLSLLTCLFKNSASFVISSYSDLGEFTYLSGWICLLMFGTIHLTNFASLSIMFYAGNGLLFAGLIWVSLIHWTNYAAVQVSYFCFISSILSLTMSSACLSSAVMLSLSKSLIFCLRALKSFLNSTYHWSSQSSSPYSPGFVRYAKSLVNLITTLKCSSAFLR